MRAETPTAARTRRRSARRASRGAVVIEALIVSGLIITVLICGVALFRVYASKVNVMRDAREATWTPALAGCGPGPSVGAVARAAELPSGEGPPTLSADVVNGWLALGQEERGRSAAVPVFGSSQAVTSERRVVCNENSGQRHDPGSLLGRFSDVLLRE